jgi:hypothetical protein
MATENTSNNTGKEEKNQTSGENQEKTSAQQEEQKAQSTSSTKKESQEESKTTKPGKKTESSAKKTTGSKKSSGSKPTVKPKSKASDKSKKEEESKEKSEGTDFWKEASENIAEGTRVINEEARAIGEKLSTYSEKIFGRIKETSSEAYRTSARLTQNAVNNAQALAEKYRDMYEMRNLNNEKKKVGSQLGMKLYLAMKNNNNTIPDDFTSYEEVKSLLEQIEEVDQKIIDLSKEIEKDKQE